MVEDQEVDLETQAVLKVKLEEAVRELIRKEMKEAFNDYNFCAQVMKGNWNIQNAVCDYSYTGTPFYMAVQNVVRQIVAK